MSTTSQSSGEELKNTKFVLFNLLRALKFFYSFKELERILGVPSQVLWRYVTLRATPEKDTAQKILNTIVEKRIVESTLEKAVESSSGEVWRLLGNPGVLELAGLKAADTLKKIRVDVVLAPCDGYSIALATIIATYLKSRICIASKYIYSNSSVVEYYREGDSIEAIAIPSDCIPKKSKVVIILATEYSTNYLDALVNIVRRRRGEIISVFSLIEAKTKNLPETVIIRPLVGSRNSSPSTRQVQKRTNKSFKN